jgi:hypothetical protein
MNSTMAARLAASKWHCLTAISAPWHKVNSTFLFEGDHKSKALKLEKRLQIHTWTSLYPANPRQQSGLMWPPIIVINSQLSVMLYGCYTIPPSSTTHSTSRFQHHNRRFKSRPVEKIVGNEGACQTRADNNNIYLRWEFFTVGGQ